MKLQTKLLSSILIPVIVGFSLTIAIVSYIASNSIYESTVKQAEETAQHYGFELRNDLENGYVVAKQTAEIFNRLYSDNLKDRKLYNQILKSSIESNPAFLGIWAIYEPNAFDGKDAEFVNQEGHDKTGRYVPYFTRQNNQIKLIASEDYDKPGKDLGDYYLVPLKSGKPEIINPYWYMVDGQKTLITSFTYPLKNSSGKIIGILGVDISLKEYISHFDQIKPFNAGYVNVISNDGTYLYNNAKQFIGKNVLDNTNIKKPEDRQTLLNNIRSATLKSYIDLDSNKLRTLVPINIGDLNQYWSIMSVIPMENVNQSKNTLIQVSVTCAIISLILLSVLLIVLIKKVVQSPLKIVHDLITKITTTGQFSHRATLNTTDEFADLLMNITNLSISLELFIQNTNQSIGALANGDFSKRLNLDLKGDLNQLQNNVNNSLDKVDYAMNQLEMIMNALKSSDFQKRIDASKFQGKYKTIAERVNQSMESLDFIIQEVNQVMTSLSAGELSKRVTSETQGDLNVLKTSINHSLDSISNIIRDLNHVFAEVSQGNLTVHIENNHYQNEFANLIHSTKDTITSLKTLIQNIIDATLTMNTAASQISAGNLDLAHRTSEQAANVEQTSATVSIFANELISNLDKTKQTNQSVNHSTAVAERGGQVIVDVINTMQEISNSSRKIGDIIGLIDNIAFQTNILALNAAVESARAGEAGKGFAVVASEVRNLAQRSSTAAKDISTLVNTTVSQIEDGARLVEIAGSTIREIVDSVRSVTQMVSEISDSSNSQANNVQEITRALHQLESITQQNAALVEEVSAASDSLNSQSTELKQSVSLFKI